MTDSELVKVVARLYRLSEEIRWLMDEEIVNHPNGESLIGALRDNGLGYNGLGYGFDCAAIAHPHLLHPDRWELTHGDGGKLCFRRSPGGASGGATENQSSPAAANDRGEGTQRQDFGRLLQHSRG